MNVPISVDFPLIWFDQLMKAGAIGEANRAHLLQQYIALSRAYHGIYHLALMWQTHRVLLRQEMIEMSPAAQQRLARAIAYHDAVYDGRSTSNEADSVALFQAQEAADPWVDSAILTTCDHFARRAVLSEEDLLREWFIGLDLCSMAAPWANFIANTGLIRAEYHHLSDAEFNARRKVFLRHALQQRPIYQHPVFVRRFEAATVANLQHALNLLE